MTFSYNINLESDTDKIRYRVQDTAPGSGPKPGGGNFEDEELEGLLLIEGSVERAVAAVYEALATSWSSVATESEIGPRREKFGETAGKYQDLAKRWRARAGYEPEWPETLSF